MTAHVAPSALLRFCKSLLQVNFAAAHSAAAPLASLFDRLLAPKLTSLLPGRPMMTSHSSNTSNENPASPQKASIARDGSGESGLRGCEGLLARTWPGLLTYCAKLVLAEASGDPPLPPFVLDNLQKALRGIGRVLVTEEAKRVAGPGENGLEAREALDVSGRVLTALSGADNGALGTRFLCLFRTIVRDGTQIRRDPLLDLGSPVGFGKPSSPGSWLTPSRTRVRVESPRGKGAPVVKAALSGSGGGQSLNSRTSSDSGATSPGITSVTEPIIANGADQKVAVPREAGEGKVHTSAVTQGLRSVNSAEGTMDRVEKEGESVGTIAAGGSCVETESEIFLGGDVDGSPGSWLTPGYKKTGAVARGSRFRGGENEDCSRAGFNSSLTRGHRLAGEGERQEAERNWRGRPTENGVPTSSLESQRQQMGMAVEGGKTRQKLSAGPEKASALDSGTGKEAAPADGSSNKRGAGTGGKIYPRALISGEWHTPEYMKPKGTVARHAKTCDRASAGLRTPDDAAAASDAMASVKKVLFAEAGDRTRGSRTLEDRRGSTLEGVWGQVSDRPQACKSVGVSVPSTGKVGGSPVVRAPGSVEKRRLATGLVEPRTVLSPLKQTGALPAVARKASPFGAQYLGKGGAHTAREVGSEENSRSRSFASVPADS